MADKGPAPAEAQNVPVYKTEDVLRDLVYLVPDIERALQEGPSNEHYYWTDETYHDMLKRFTGKELVLDEAYDHYITEIFDLKHANIDDYFKAHGNRKHVLSDDLFLWNRIEDEPWRETSASTRFYDPKTAQHSTFCILALNCRRLKNKFREFQIRKRKKEDEHYKYQGLERRLTREFDELKEDSQKKKDLLDQLQEAKKAVKSAFRSIPHEFGTSLDCAFCNSSVGYGYFKLEDQVYARMAFNYGKAVIKIKHNQAFIRTVYPFNPSMFRLEELTSETVQPYFAPEDCGVIMTIPVNFSRPKYWQNLQAIAAKTNQSIVYKSWKIITDGATAKRAMENAVDVPADVIQNLQRDIEAAMEDMERQTSWSPRTPFVQLLEFTENATAQTSCLTRIVPGPATTISNQAQPSTAIGNVVPVADNPPQTQPTNQAGPSGMSYSAVAAKGSSLPIKTEHLAVSPPANNSVPQTRPNQLSFRQENQSGPSGTSYSVATAKEPVPQITTPVSTASTQQRAYTTPTNRDVSGTNAGPPPQSSNTCSPQHVPVCTQGQINLTACNPSGHPTAPMNIPARAQTQTVPQTNLPVEIRPLQTSGNSHGTSRMEFSVTNTQGHPSRHSMSLNYVSAEQNILIQQQGGNTVPEMAQVVEQVHSSAIYENVHFGSQNLRNQQQQQQQPMYITSPHNQGHQQMGYPILQSTPPQPFMPGGAGWSNNVPMMMPVQHTPMFYASSPIVHQSMHTPPSASYFYFPQGTPQRMSQPTMSPIMEQQPQYWEQVRAYVPTPQTPGVQGGQHHHNPEYYDNSIWSAQSDDSYNSAWNRSQQ